MWQSCKDTRKLGIMGAFKINLIMIKDMSG